MRTSGHEAGDRVLDALKEQWAEAAGQFVEDATVHDKPPKFNKVKAKDCAVALDNMLVSCTGRGLAAFTLPVPGLGPVQGEVKVGDKRKRPQTLIIEGLASTMQQAATPEAIADLPVLGLAIDQGSDMWAVTFFCLNVLHMNLCVLFDSSHAVWNDCRLAIQSTPGLNMQMPMILLILN